MKKVTLLLAFALTTGAVFAQKKTTTSAVVSFDATTPKDALPKADNKTVVGALNTQTGAVAFEAAVANFAFSNPKIQEHFNAPNWLNSAEFPKFTYSGTIQNLNKVNFAKNGTYNVEVKGNMTVKGVTKPVDVKGTITVADGKISISSEFSITLSEFGVTGQAIDAGKVATEPKITVNAQF